MCVYWAGFIFVAIGRNDIIRRQLGYISDLRNSPKYAFYLGGRPYNFVACYVSSNVCGMFFILTFISCIFCFIFTNDQQMHILTICYCTPQLLRVSTHSRRHQGVFSMPFELH
jgi:hypothetical protein